MTLKPLALDFSICTVADPSQIDLTAPFCFVGKTDQELSLVCPQESVPARTLQRDDGWRAFRIEGQLDFSLVGILSKISDILAREKIGIFAVSTYQTDYVLTKASQFPRALDALAAAGYEIA